MSSAWASKFSSITDLGPTWLPPSHDAPRPPGGARTPPKSLLLSAAEEGKSIHLRLSDLIASFLWLIDANLSRVEQEPLSKVPTPRRGSSRTPFADPQLLRLVCRIHLFLSDLGAVSTRRDPEVHSQHLLPHTFNRANEAICDVFSTFAEMCINHEGCSV